MYCRDCTSKKFYYESIQLNVAMTGNYSVNGYNSVYAYGYIYKNNFDPLKPSENVIAESQKGPCYNLLKLPVYLQIEFTYVLVVTTNLPGWKEVFPISVFTANNITFKRISE
jgi:hypothetical protein